MKQQEIFKKIGVIIKELSDQYEYLQLADDNLNDLELELFVANARFLTDHIEILVKFNLQNSNSRQTVIENNEQRFFEPVVQQSTIETGQQDEIPNLPVKEEILFENAYLNHEVKTDDGPREAQEIIPEEPKTYTPEYVNTDNNFNDYQEYRASAQDIFSPQVTPAIIEPESPSLISERNNSNQNIADNGALTLNDKISAQMAERYPLKAEPKEPPLSDIKQGITLNDKLLYVKDLFNGYNLAYSEAIEILNRFSNLEDATKFLKTNYIIKNNWESKPETYNKFLALLNRRYA